MRSIRTPLALSAAAVLALAGCAGSGDPDPASSDATGKPLVVTDMYPTTFAVQQVAGDAVEIVQLAPPGVEPHDYELTPKQVQQVADADLVAYLPGMIPAVAQAIEQEAAGRAVDVTEGITLLEGHAEEGAEHAQEEGEEHADTDPHVWLNPNNVTVMGQNVATALAKLGITADAAGLQQEMTALDAEMSAALDSCAIPYLVTAHEAFGYLADAHGFEQVGISGLSPEAQPSPAKLAEITDLVREKGITTIYVEQLLPPDAAEAIASETGASTALLDPIEGNTDDKGYVSIMQANTQALKTGQSCS